MSLIGTLLGNNGNFFDEREAVAAILYIAVVADGAHTEEEEELFVAVSNRMRLLRDQTPLEFNEMISKIKALVEKQGIQAVLEQADGAVPEQLRETTYALAVDLVFADGRVAGKETEILQKIKAALSIPDELAQKIEEVLEIKNRG